MTVELSKSQIDNLAEFIEFNFIDSIRKDEWIDNIMYVSDMMNAFQTLKDASKKCEDVEETE